MALHVVGVRHHSPACARLVGRVIASLRPRFVLIEGPADMNMRVGELSLPHRLPIAIFSYSHREGVARSSWSPFCAYSPEWVALAAARQTGAEARFMDLPAWDEAFLGVENRYSDRHWRASARVAALCARLGLEDSDSLWDHLFEQPMETVELAARLRVYFAELRAGEPAGDRDAPREAHMARAIAWAMAECEGKGGDVVAVCGGFHAPALEAGWCEVGDASWPPLPVPAGGARVGSYLVPYSFHRLDSFVGYESGMPSPAYHQAVWDVGTDQAAEEMLKRAVERVRKKKQPVSAADVIAASTLCQGLMRLRGHAAIARVDLLDALAGALVKEALDAPLPWNRRGRLLPGTDPMLVEVVAAFCGERVGALAHGTPRPPLLADVAAELAAHGLTPEAKPRTVTIPLDEPAGLARSRVLNRLRVLAVPGFTRVHGPEWATDAAVAEEWTITLSLDADAALIEAAAYGATLESAAAGRLEEALLRAEGRLAELARVLGEATFIGIETLARRVLDRVGQAVGVEPSLEALGEALARLLGLWRYDTLLGSAGSPALGVVIEAAFERGLWLFEGVQGAAAPTSEALLHAVVALRDTLRHGEGRLAVGRARAHPVMGRRALDPAAPPALRGAALGFLWSTGHYADPAAAESEATLAVRKAARPTLVGDFLFGLFALAREEVMEAPELVGAIDAVLGGMDERDFLVALPALRLAFSYFPPSEKERIAQAVLALHGGEPLAARDFLRLEVGPDATALGMRIDAEVTRLASRFGLEDPTGGEP